MALVSTTLSSAATASQDFIVVASATSVAAGRLVQVDAEVMQVRQHYTSGTTVPVVRGINGTAALAHVSSAVVTHGTAQDFGLPGIASVVNYPPAGRTRSVTGYSAAGAITLPKPGEDAVAILYGTAIAMTLADPDEALTGSILYIINGTAAAHTVTSAGGFGGAGSSYDVLTFDTSGTNCVHAMACNGNWVLIGLVDGTITSVATSIA